jgi:hypothetical protein
MASPQSQELARRAGVIYEQRLRAQLEHAHPDEFVAIEPDSRDYFLGRTLSDAIQAPRSAHATRLPFVLRVGHEATVECGLVLLAWHDYGSR